MRGTILSVLAIFFLCTTADAETLTEFLRKKYPQYSERTDLELKEAFRKKYYPNRTIAELEEAALRRPIPVYIEEHDITVNFPSHYDEDRITKTIQQEILPHLKKNRETWYFSKWPQNTVYVGTEASGGLSGYDRMLLEDITDSLSGIRTQMLLD